MRWIGCLLLLALLASCAMKNCHPVLGPDAEKLQQRKLAGTIDSIGLVCVLALR